MSEASLPVVSVMFESVTIWVSNTMVDSVTTVVRGAKEWSMGSKFVVWDCHVVEWLVEDIMLNVTFWEVTEAWSPDSINLVVVLLSLALDSFPVVFPSIGKFGSECSFILMWSKLMMSVWLISIDSVVMDWVVVWSVWGVMVIEVSSNVMCGSIFIVVWGGGMVIISMSPVGSPVVNFTVVAISVVWCIMGVVSVMSVSVWRVVSSVVWDEVALSFSSDGSSCNSGSGKECSHLLEL